MRAGQIAGIPSSRSAPAGVARAGVAAAGYRDGVTPELAARVVADARDRVAWVRARSRGITATDVATLTSERAIARAADAKLGGSGFSGNAFTAHGRAREPQIAAWVAATHGIQPSSALFHAEIEKRHLATPDGIAVDPSGRVTLAEIKTTNKAWRSIPRSYLRQVWWQQHVLGAERTLVAWEQHDDFVPVHDEPRCVWIDRDDAQIAQLVHLATALIDELYERTTGRRAPRPAERTPRPAPRQPFRALALAD
ncbi:hypothetical protein GCM10022200_29010 [Microbacterium awajiense]|uniref:YqaJ viral recombinase domain-containing protein n=1 Tax=Microbacterium awajiense TaxID=415214 RepID=A0ABP7AY42_9MICO